MIDDQFNYISLKKEKDANGNGNDLSMLILYKLLYKLRRHIKKN